MHVGLMGVSILPEGTELPARPLGFELYPSRATKATGSGTVVFQWLGAAQEGEHRRFFHLLLPRLSADDALGCYQIAENAAMLALPEPALAVNGEFEDIGAEVALLAEDHAVALGMTRLPWASATTPVSLHWDFGTGTLIVQAGQATQLTIAGEEHALEPGIHTLTVARPDDVPWTGRLAGWLEQARAERERELAAAGEPAAVAAPEMAASAEGAIGGKPVASEVIAREEGDLVALAEGQTVHLLAADGSEVRALQADGPVRVLRWWPEEELLLVGCTDEQVIAFDLAGERRWVFVSEMDPAVWESGKTYWFKSAYPGIHGLHTGVVSGEESLAFVGSACTLEAVNADGQLVKRLPIFWGNCWKFQIVDRADGGRNLLIAQWANGTDNLSIVNGDTLTETGKGYYGVPAGHTMVGGWTQQNRTGIEYADVNGDGERELVSATNGIWNRLTVFSGSGTPLFNAQFGPGESAQPYSTMRDMAVADLDGDGDLEIVVAISEGLIVTLDHECRKVWATRLPSAPTRLEIVTPAAGAPAIIAGCEDGTIVRLSGSGEITAQTDAGGRVETLQTVRSPQGPLAVAATAEGAVSIYPVD